MLTQTAEVQLAKKLISLSPDKNSLPYKSAKFINFRYLFFLLFLFNYVDCFHNTAIYLPLPGSRIQEAESLGKSPSVC